MAGEFGGEAVGGEGRECGEGGGGCFGLGGRVVIVGVVGVVLDIQVRVRDI